MTMIPHHISRFNQASRFCPLQSCQICLNPAWRAGCEGAYRARDGPTAERLRSRRPQPTEPSFRSISRVKPMLKLIIMIISPEVRSLLTSRVLVVPRGGIVLLFDSSLVPICFPWISENGFKVCRKNAISCTSVEKNVFF